MIEMNIPEKVKVGYKDYKVIKVDHLDDELKLLYGRVDFDIETIKLCNRYPENHQKCTSIHELVHAVDEMQDIKLTEDQVIKLGTGLYQVIKDNPNMFTDGGDTSEACKV
jgi:phosphomevalonate kinase